MVTIVSIVTAVISELAIKRKDSVQCPILRDEQELKPDPVNPLMWKLDFVPDGEGAYTVFIP